LAEAATPETAPVTELKPPSNVRLSPVLAGVVKLVQSGVGEPVLLSYITNTTGYFALGAEEIVYLNDLGVAGQVMTAMMEHDQWLRELRMNAVQAAQPAVPIQTAPEPAEPEMASAPSYVNPPALEAEPVYVSNEYFYDTLAPYGSWAYVPGYGRCWRPTVAVCNPGWRPYCDRGRWVCSDTGWYWLSDYTWGATAFHYGRWFNHGSWGWCWSPDTVWAPSWVCWRYSNDYCGWAPLPPTAGYHVGVGLTYQNGEVGAGFGFGLGFQAYTFVSWGNFCGPRPYQHYLPPSHANQVYHQTTPVNHFEDGGRGRVYNRGPSAQRVSERSRTEVRIVNVREQPAPGTRGERLDRDGRILAVHRPNLIPASTAGGSDLQPSVRDSARRGNEAVAAPAPFKPVNISPTTAGRTEVRPEPNVGRTGNRIGSPLVPVSAPTVAGRPTVTTPTRIETQPGRVERPVEAVTANRAQQTSPVVVRAPQTSVSPVAPVTPTPWAPQPRVIQITPQTAQRPSPPAPSSSVIVIGGRNNATRSTGRDYSVWSTPTPAPAPTPSIPPSSPRDNFAARPGSAPVVNTPQIAENSPSVSRSSRNDTGRVENRGSYSTYSAPQPGRAIPPSSSYTARPAPSSPAPSYTPRPTPSAPTAPASVPATSRPAPSQGRPGR